ncbi:MAG TPA: glycosyltransferase [Bryobacteraceae bacterium]|jgi:dolichol-phosphate mannosyltransferase|nr:glycosyltransferase [Bryobacteraceae bacterium]
MREPEAVQISILLPVRNEGINLRIMLKILPAILEMPHEVLVVCDHLEDTSIPIVTSMQQEYSNLRLIHNQLGAGVTNAIRAGVESARGQYVLIFAADEMGPVLAIEDMLALMEEGCDFVSCTRYAHGGRRLGGSTVGQILSRTANRLFHAISGCVLTDATTGIKLIRRSVFNHIQLEAGPAGWAVAFEMSMKAQLAGFKLGEVPIISIDRLYGGESSFRVGPWVVEYLRWFVWGSMRLRKRSNLQNPPVSIRGTSGVPLAAQVKRP